MEGWCAVFQRLLILAAVLTGLAVAPAYSRDPADAQTYPALAGLRYGISVTDLDGSVLVAHRADERFMPASNVKLFVTAAALAAETALSELEAGLQVVLEPAETGPPALALVGRGDPTVGFGPDCTKRCIETLAEAVAATGISEVGDIVGDDQWFADERRPLGWSWDDLKFGHGTSISAIAVNENILPLWVSPSGVVGAGVRASWGDAGQSYFNLENEAKTSDATAPRALRLERRIGERTARLYGELPRGPKSLKLDLGVDNPAHLAAWFFKRALEAKGVSVSGALRTRRRPLQYADEPALIDADNPDAPLSCTPRDRVSPKETVIAALPPAPVQEIVTKINRDSQNLYAEILLRQLGRAAGRGSSFCGLLQIEQLLARIGVPPQSYDIADGSGLSAYNRATPATITALLRHAAAEPWGDAYRASLPVGGGATGTLKYRFRGSELEGKIFAKTGTLNHVDALSGYLQARSGRMLVFSIMVNDRPLKANSAMSHIAATLLTIAEQH
ncbi:MAG: D-alanyl-D-alanine carboxypeptidase/D-alanyl-D-alanine-endopeptidase [Pseudomonadota bacterium]